MLDDWHVVSFPCLATIERSPYEQSIAGSVMRPVVEGAKFVECHVANECAPMIVESG
jgi:hypothetical protein